MKLTCDICGGELQMDSNNQGATCVDCGINYTVESLRNKLGSKPNTEPEVKSAEPKAAAVEDDIPFANVTAAEDDTYSTATAGASAEPVQRYLIVDRKFDLQALVFALFVYIDGEEVCCVAKSDKVVLPINQGNHKLEFVVKHGGKKNADAVLQPQDIFVADHNWYAQFSIRRTAWTANWQVKVIEDVNDSTLGIENETTPLPTL